MHSRAQQAFVYIVHKESNLYLMPFPHSVLESSLARTSIRTERIPFSDEKTGQAMPEQ